TPNITSDIYDLASVTKITATLPAIIKLYDSRKINLEAPLSDYYPPLKETDIKDITVQEVLCHNAGMKP
ncbi:serine hydrolase, partial [Odoribacter splanchnicus]|uniref:serine hydrolase n=1 Tax=Odoribacter splanchnicus TaxID=28118 RepID=UPI00210AA6A9